MKITPSNIALNRVNLGVTNDIVHDTKTGWSAWAKTRLKPASFTKDAALRHIPSHELKIEVEHEGMMAPASNKAEEQMCQVKAERRLPRWKSPRRHHVKLRMRKPSTSIKMVRCSHEDGATRIIRACHSKWQVSRLRVGF